MKRLVALLLVCVLVLFSTLALADEDEDEVSIFTPQMVLALEESRGYTKPSDWTARSDTRAGFSVMLHLDYLFETFTATDIDWDKATFVLEKDNILGLAYCNQDGAYKMLLYIPALKIASYSLVNSYEYTPAEMKKLLEANEFTVYENSKEDIAAVRDAVANGLE